MLFLKSHLQQNAQARQLSLPNLPSTYIQTSSGPQKLGACETEHESYGEGSTSLCPLPVWVLVILKQKISEWDFAENHFSRN